MPNLNSGSSIYHEIQVLYWRTAGGTLLAVEGRHAELARENWPQIWAKIEAWGKEQSNVTTSSEGWHHTIQLTDPSEAGVDKPALPSSVNIPEDAKLEVRETRRPGTDENVIGMVMMLSSGQQATELRDWTCRFVLAESQFLPLLRMKDSNEKHAEARNLADEITDIFEEKLRNIASDDQWIVGGGRDYFTDRVFGFTQRRERLRLCLPAFPCKTSNRQKANGATPDRAEEIALGVLDSFSRQVATIYEPGATISVISDGHVFSDCIGVDDDAVDAYGRQLQEMYGRLYAQPQLEPSIEFVSLWEIFFSNPNIAALFKPSLVQGVEIPHFLDTQVNNDAEVCREGLMASCQIDPEALRQLIKSEDKGTVALYRGFSRFMFEDLAVHPNCVGKSASQKKKLATKVASEMIKRNQAYSNLVELLYPSHVRLSIHAHDNRGPKFGIRMFPSPAVRTIKSLDDRDEPPTDDLLHTPTPWHNCIIEIKGDPMLYLTKSRTALGAIDDDRYEGSWTKPDQAAGGKYFSLVDYKDPPADIGSDKATNNTLMPVPKL